MNLIKKLLEFHTYLFNKTKDTRNRPNQFFISGSQTAKHRYNLIKEEANELLEAIETGTEGDIRKEAVDLVYVVLGSSVTWGHPFYEDFKTVHLNNLAKIATGTMSDSGKLVKHKDHPKVKLEPIDDPHQLTLFSHATLGKVIG